MSRSLLALAAAHLERVGNPMFGRRANDDAVMEFAEILADEETTDRFRREIALLDDVSLFGAYGWLWLIGWCKANDAELPTRLVLDLIEQWDATAFKAEALELIAPRVDLTANATSIEEFPHDALRELLRRVVAAREAEGDDPEPSDHRDTHGHNAETTLFALIAVDRPLTDAAARVLVAHDWSGRGALRSAVMGRIEMLDDDTRQVWLEGLGLGTPAEEE